ncbi:hypothetical protein HALA3H3_p20046 [Halomonas sp. A3H3]|nr:hypothetical protein HALA3H3_p20046 [Halomonas sp. A3H3]
MCSVGVTQEDAAGGKRIPARCKKSRLSLVGAMAADAALIVEDDAALGDETLTQPLSGAAQARLGGRQAQAMVVGVVRLATPLQVAATQDIAILRSEMGQRTFDAVDQALHGGGRRRLRGDLGGCLVRPVFRAPLLIDPLVPCHAEQPGTGRIQFAELPAVGQRLGIDGLQEVVGGITIAAVSDQEATELITVSLPGGLDAGVWVRLGRHRCSLWVSVGGEGSRGCAQAHPRPAIRGFPAPGRCPDHRRCTG